MSIFLTFENFSQYSLMVFQSSDLDFVVGEVSFRDKCVTKFKGILVNAWNCRLYIQGSPEYLTFIYNVGLGSKNSQGFGMINVIEE